MGQTSISAIYISKATSSTDPMSPMRRYRVEVESNTILIEVSDHKLTAGWLLSEVIRKYNGRRSIVALRTARNLDILDWWLTHFDKKLTPISSDEQLVAVFEKPVSGDTSPLHFRPIKVIGRGAFSKVILARKKNNGLLYAVKTISKEFVLLKQKAEHIVNEKEILSKLRHPFIVQLHFAFQTSSDLHLVMDFCPGGELFYHLQNIGRLNEEQARFYFCELLLAIEHLHSFHIVYRDLKPENILLDVDEHIRLADFGLAKEMKGPRTRSSSFCGSPEYMSPEMLERRDHGREVDFYSLGAFLYEMLTGLPPYYSQDPKQMKANILKGAMVFPATISKPVKNLMAGLLQKDYRLRLGTFEGVPEIKRHPWLEGVNWEAILKKQAIPPFYPNLKMSNFDPECTSEPLRYHEFTEENYKPSFDDPFFMFSESESEPPPSPVKEKTKTSTLHRYNSSLANCGSTNTLQKPKIQSKVTQNIGNSNRPSLQRMVKDLCYEKPVLKYSYKKMDNKPNREVLHRKREGVANA